MTVELIHTDASHPDFTELTKLLDDEFFAAYGEAYLPYQPLNQPSGIRLAVVVYVNGQPAACGALKPIHMHTAELKRIFVHPHHRRRGLAQRVVRGLEQAALSEGFPAQCWKRAQTCTPPSHCTKSLDTLSQTTMAPMRATRPVSACQRSSNQAISCSPLYRCFV